jgi:DHA1 family bicyclomycin/chloramphenicol resistance-like MFS transporter
LAQHRQDRGSDKPHHHPAALALAPAVGPIIGGQVHVWFGWRANFLLVTALVVLVTVLVWRFLPETLDQRDHDAIRPMHLARGYLDLLGDRRFMAYTNGRNYRPV